MKKCSLLFSYLMLFFSVFAQNEKEGQLIKYSSVDSQMTIRPELMNQLEQGFKKRATKAINKITPGKILLTSIDKNDKDSIGNWLRTRKKQDLYRVDLSAFMNKYIGETEKNLDKVFNNAQKNNWILFFDEADALFGKRTAVKDSHDKFANQEVSYLLEKIMKYSGIVLMSCNSGDCSTLFRKQRFKEILTAR